MERRPDALLEEAQRQIHDDSARLARLNCKALVHIASERMILQALCHAPCHGLEEVQEVPKHSDMSMFSATWPPM